MIPHQKTKIQLIKNFATGVQCEEEKFVCSFIYHFTTRLYSLSANVILTGN